jgi:hypothetical protein
LQNDTQITEPPPKDEFPVGLPKLDMDLFKVWQEAFQKIGGVESLVEWASDDKNKRKFYEMGVSLQPKNIRVQQEHNIRFVEVPMKVRRPELRNGDTTIDTLGVEISNTPLAKGTKDGLISSKGQNVKGFRETGKEGKERKLKRDNKLTADREKEGIDGH